MSRISAHLLTVPDYSRKKQPSVSVKTWKCIQFVQITVKRKQYETNERLFACESEWVRQFLKYKEKRALLYK